MLAPTQRISDSDECRQKRAVESATQIPPTPPAGGGVIFLIWPPTLGKNLTRQSIFSLGIHVRYLPG